MPQIFVRGLAIAISLSVLALLMTRATRHAEVPVVSPAPVGSPAPLDAAVQDSASPQELRLRPAERVNLKMLRGPATKADPHLAKVLAEEAAKRSGVIQLLPVSKP